MQNHALNLIKTGFKKLENRMARIELLLKKDVAEEKKIEKELKGLEKEEKDILKIEKELEKEERKLLDEMKKIEAEEDWDSDLRFYCKFKLMNEDNVVICGKHSSKKPCAFKLCSIK